MNQTLCRTIGSVATVAAAALMLAPASSLADTLDFSLFSQGRQSNTVMVLPQATITSFGSDLYVNASGNNDVCAIRSFSCDADLQIAFTGAVNDLSFVVNGWDPGDRVDINVFSGASFLGTVVQAANGLVDLGGFSNITRIFLDDSSTGAGMGYGSFSFSATAPIPEPETYALMLAGLGLLGLSARRRKLKAAG
jgi:hypothetical protein